MSASREPLLDGQEPILSFRPSTATKATEVVGLILTFVACFLGAALTGFVVFGGFLFALKDVIGEGPATWIGGLLALGAVWLIFRTWWRRVKRRAQNSLHLFLDGILLGEGRFRERIDYEDVEFINLAPIEIESDFTDWGDWIEIRFRKETRRFFLDTPVANRCARALFDTCPNAVAVDRNGREHLPQESNRPLRALDVLIAHKVRKRQHLLVYTACTLVCLTGSGVVLLMGWLIGDQPGSPKGMIAACITVPIWLIVVACLTRAAFKITREIREVSQARYDAEASGVADEPLAVDTLSDEVELASMDNPFAQSTDELS